ncbi:MAG: DUF1847 domain-containing protein [Armatimonadota bacterium]
MSVVYPCAECRMRACIKGGVYPPGCPSTEVALRVEHATLQASADPWVCRVMVESATLPRRDDGALRNRVEETMAFCRQMGFTTLGVAFCVALAKEACQLCAALTDAGFTVVPVCCKVGGVTLETYGGDPAAGRSATACHPVAQAEICNAHQTDLNILVGLCVGHDVLFTRHAESPVTTLIVKDRALQHNPVAALRDR